MPSRHPTSSPAFRFWVVGVVLTAVAGFALWDAVVRGRHVLAMSDGYGVAVDAPTSAPASPTGYADGRRSLVLPTGASDTAHWIMQTQTMIARGDWRIREVDYDNAPAGREVHWAAPFHWWLAGLAWIDHGISGRPVGQSVERAVIWSGPVMFALLLPVLTVFLFRRFSALATAVVVIGIVAVFPFYMDFAAGYADHHGVANICGLLTVLFLVTGATGESGEPVRRWFVAAGVAGGVGLWISAATQVPVLLGVGVGVLASAWLGRGAGARLAWVRDPSLWRTWGLAGGGMSLAAWLLEYFPHHLGMRLEVNHPLYAAAWIGAGETLRVAVLALRDGPRSLSGRDRLMGAVGATLVVLLPAVIVLTAARTFVVADLFVWQVHALYISEFQHLSRILSRGWNWMATALCLPMLLLVPPLIRLLRRTTSAELRAELALVLVPAVIGWCMGWSQVRWMSLAFALSVPVVAVFFRAGETGRSRTAFLGWLAAAGLLFGPGLVKAGQRAWHADEFKPDDITNLAVRDVAHWLRQRGGAARVVVAASPSPTSRLIYHGSLVGVDTLYWENAAGLKNAAELYAAPTAAAAREIAARLGVTHIVFFSWDAFEGPLAQLARGLPEDAPMPADSFAAQLLGSPVPPAWLQAIPFKLPDHPALAEQHVRIWEVVPEQTPAAALARATNYFLELGRTQEAGRLAPALVRFDDDLPALVMLAGIASRARDAEGFGSVFGRIMERLPRAESLALDEHIHLVVVLAVGQQAELAQTQLRRAMDKVDETSLRHLTAGTLADLIALSDGLQVAWPTSALHNLAQKLVPPDQRK